MEKLLIVDDNEEIRRQLKWGLGQHYQVLLAGDGREAMELFERHRPRVMTLDLGLPPDADGTSEGMHCLREVLRAGPQTKVIVLTGNEERQTALEAVQLGAYDYYQKPIVLAELQVILARAFHLAGLEEDNRRLQAALSSDGTAFEGIFGQSAQMLKVFETIRKVATCDVPVLLLGESGTGKELVARAIHSQSLWHDGPFIPINCGAIPEALLESELFGHEKGAFTGAQARVQGKLEYADKGTLFLDEIGELPLLLQVKLLRFLQDQTFQRVGGREDIQINTRIIAATNVNIEDAIAGGNFREDLYYRIGVITLPLPPLRERGDDLVLLATLFLRRFADALKKRVRGFSAGALDALKQAAWPGNVRELENRVKRAVVMAEGAIIEASDLGFGGSAGERPAAEIPLMPLREAKDRLEQQMLVTALETSGGNVVKAAEQLGVSRPTLYDLMKKHHLYAGGS